jgi:protein-S-isoprenylcysteine O-methyltransferase Ste14
MSLVEEILEIYQEKQMVIIEEYLSLIIYFLIFAVIKISERAVLIRPENHIRKGWGDWTVWLILIPLWIVLIGPVLEFIFLGHRPELWEMIFGGVLFIAAGFFSIKGYMDLQHGFTKAIELEDTSLVVTGLYHVIRHPISLGNILFCLACPLFLAAGPSWIPALIGVLGIMLRISIEESFIQQHVPDYESYKARTWALVPYIY